MRDLKFEKLVVHQPTNRAMVIFSEAHGNRCLAMAVGEAERRQIVLAARDHQTADSPSYAALIAAIDRIGGRVERAVITDLVDGVFQAHVDVRTEDAMTPLDARPVDAFVLTLITGCPLYATPSVLDLAGTVPNLVASDPGPDEVADPQGNRTRALTWNDDVAPLAVFHYRRRWIDSVNRVVSAAALGGAAFAALAGVVFGIVVVVVALTAWHNADTAELHRDTRAGLLVVALLGCAWGLIALRWVANFLFESRRAVLEIYPIGVVFRLPSGPTIRAPWRAIGDTGPVGRLPGAPECLRFSEPLHLTGTPSRFIPAIRGIPLSTFDPNWRSGELGSLMRRFQPRLLGVVPVDPAGGAVAF